MGLLRTLLYLVPVRLGSRRDDDGMRGGLLTNRRDHGSGLVLLGDVVENTRDAWMRFSRRIPDDSALARDDENRFRGSLSNGPHHR